MIHIGVDLATFQYCVSVGVRFCVLAWCRGPRSPRSLAVLCFSIVFQYCVFYGRARRVSLVFPCCAAVWIWDFGFSIVFYCCVFVLCFGIVFRVGVLECGFSICAGVPGPRAVFQYWVLVLCFSIVFLRAGSGALVLCFSIVFQFWVFQGRVRCVRIVFQYCVLVLCFLGPGPVRQ